MSNPIAVILSKSRKSEPDSERLEQEILIGLQRWPGVEVLVVPHLYDLNTNGAGVEALRSIAGGMIVLAWLYPRAAYWVLDANGVKGRLGPTASLPREDFDQASPAPDRPERTVWCLDLRTYDQAEKYLEEIARILSAAGVGRDGIPSYDRAATATGGADRAALTTGLDEAIRPRWYPVIDRGRCANCLECLNFCLFGVFGLDGNDAILIEQPDACRFGCPACSRVCPQGAIMFPHHIDPAIAGDPRASREGLGSGLVQLLGASPAELAARQREQALAEQQSHLPRGDSAAAGSTGRDELDRLVDELDELEL